MEGTSHIFSSNEIINEILNHLNVIKTGNSTYLTHQTITGKYIRLRISDHGVNMSSWYRNNNGEDIPLNESVNISLTFLPNREECLGKGLTFPQKAINKTNVFKGRNSKQIIDYNFTIIHYVYASWKINYQYLELIIESILIFIETGRYVDNLSETSAKPAVFEDVSNKEYKKLKM